jgi:hypothetical protein
VALRSICADPLIETKLTQTAERLRIGCLDLAKSINELRRNEMKYLRKLSLSLTLICVLAAAVFGGETSTPPCVPGETLAPPCSSQSVNDDSADPGETLTPPALPAVDVTDIAETVLWALLLF